MFGALTQRGDVTVGAGDVGAVWSAVVDVRRVPVAAFVAGQAAGGLVRVEHARHAFALVDLEVGVGEEGGGLAAGVQDAASEAGGGVDALPLGVGGWAADVLTVLEPVVGLRQGFQLGQPFLEGQIIGEAGGVAAGIPEGHGDADVPVLDRGSDPATPIVRDEPREGAA